MSERLPDGVFAGAVEGQRSVAGLVLAETRYGPGFRVESHAHQHTLLAAVLEGAFTEQRGRARIACPEGTLIVQPPDEAHAHVFHPERGARCFTLQYGDAWARRMAAFGVEEPARPLDVRGGRANHLLEEIRREYRLDDPAGGLVVEGYALALLGEVGRGLAAGRERGARPGWLLRAVEYLHDHLDEPVEMAEVAARVDIHPVHLARTFRRFYGCSMGEYLRALRVGRARRLLVETDLPLSRVALDAGFSDQPHLTRVFRAHTGLTPGRYRTAARGAEGPAVDREG